MTSALTPFVDPFLNVVPPPPPAAVPTFRESREEARAALLGDVGPIPDLVKRHQSVVLDRVLDRLGSEPRGHRLYVLEVGGRYPRVKVGASENVWRRLKEHIAEMNLWQHGLLDAHVTDPMPNGFARKGAEDEALRFMGSFFQRMSREHFVEASFRDATVIADVAVQLNREIEAPAARPV